MNMNDTLWHLERVANSGILGQPEKVALQQASQLLHELNVIRDMPQQTAEEVKDFYERVGHLMHLAGKL